MAKVRLEVTEEILDRVIFGMENQVEILYLDISEGILKSNGDDETQLIPLPPWGPTEGYRLMDSFSASISGLMAAQQIQDILSSGSKVVQAFQKLSGRKTRIGEALAAFQA